MISRPDPLPEGQNKTHWSRLPEKGSALGMAILIAIYRLLGDRVARALLRPIVAWFLLTGGDARRASNKYLKQLSRYSGGTTPHPGWRSAYRHMLEFAEAGLDKVVACIANMDPDALDFPNRAEFYRILQQGRGAILLGAHVGNQHMLRTLAINHNIARINAIVYTKHSQRFSGALTAASARFGVNLIQIGSFGPETGIALQEIIDRGEALAIVGDRTPPAGNVRVVNVDFLGESAPLPQGPYILAALLDCPVCLFFCVKKAQRYHVHFELFADHIKLPRGEREAAIQVYAQRYANRLEEICLQAPLQWFNFFDFWHAGK